MKMLLNEKVRKCAFCKHWYDPTNSALEPAFGKGMWRVDTTMKNKCLINNTLRRATGGSCYKFASKL